MSPLSTLLLIISLALISTFVAADPDSLQDICVADYTTGIKVNGYPCKENVSSADFFSSLLSKPGMTNNSYGSLVTGANVMKLPGLNTLGVSLARIDFARGGINPPHTHPRATEAIYVLEGELDVGFITTGNVLYTAHVVKGDVFVFPKALVHFQKNNNWKKTAAVLSAFNSQLPGTQSLATTLFGASPQVPDNVLTKAFKIGTKEVDKIKSRFVAK
ncbi:hypothetical protein ACFE04_005384 [Oxalis oulophora]